MAERMAVKLSGDRGLAVEARSCGIAAQTYYKPPAEIAAALKPLGLTCEGHVAQLVSRELLRWCDAALAMTRQQREAVLDAYPEFSAKVFLLRRYAGLDDQDVADPIGQPQPVYDACRDQLHAALDRLIGPATVSNQLRMLPKDSRRRP